MYKKKMLHEFHCERRRSPFTFNVEDPTLMAGTLTETKLNHHGGFFF